MTHEEIADWVHAIAPTPERRLRLLNEMLSHGGPDRMSRADLRVCRIAKAMTEEEIALTELVTTDEFATR